MGLGCRYLEWFDGFERTSVATPTRGCTLDGVRVIHSGVIDWKPDREYDLVLCLQVLEHIHAPVDEERLQTWLGCELRESAAMDQGHPI